MEFDVRVSRDGVPVVIHDATVDRTTDGSGPVAGFSVAELGDLDAGDGERIPTLEQVFETLGLLPAIVEIKERESAPQVMAALRRLGVAPRVLVGSFVVAALRAARRAGFAVAASRPQAARSWVASRVGLTWGGPFAAFSLPPESRGRVILDAKFLAAARRLRRPVHAWTIDDPAAARRLRGLGVAGLITNYPARMAGLAFED